MTHFNRRHPGNGSFVAAVCLAVGVGVVSAVPATGQARQDDPVAQARTALAEGETETALRLARRLTRRQPENVAAWMVLGRAALVLMEEGFRESRAQTAVRAFDRVAELNPSQSDLYYLRGRAYLEGLQDSTRAGTDFDRQLQIDPGHTEALVGLLELAADLRQWDLAEELASTALVNFPDDERIYRPLLQLYLRQEAWGAAALVARRYLAMLPPDGRQMISDLDPLLATEEAERYRAMTPGERDLYRRRYWARRGGDRLDGYSHRFLEHIWRIAEARTRFGRSDRQIDIRAELLIRYGPPEYQVTSTSGLSLNMILDGEFQSRWRQLLLDLEVPMGAWESGDFTSFFNPDFEAPRGVNRFEFWIYRSEGILFRFMETTVGSGYQLAAGSGDLNSALKHRRPVISGLEEKTVPLEPAFQIAQFRAPDGRTRLHAAFSIPVIELRGTMADSIPSATLLTQVLLTDQAGAVAVEAERSRTIRSGEATRLQRSLRFIEALALTAEPGEYGLAGFLADRASGRYGSIEAEELTVRDFSGPGLSLSDLVLAAADSPGVWEQHLSAEGIPYLPQPATVFDRERPFSLYFEIYHLDRDAAGVAEYELTYEIFPEPGSHTLPAEITSSVAALLGLTRGTPVVSVQTTDRTPRAPARHRLELSLSDHPEGLYRLRVRVYDIRSATEVAWELLFLVLDTSPPTR